jgi:hypothetical protein
VQNLFSVVQKNKINLLKLTVMKKIFLIPFILGMICFVTSCTKQSSSDILYIPAPDEIINAKIAPGQPYSLNLSGMGNVSIIKQGTHFSVSEIVAANENGSPAYKYVPASGFNGTDEVMLYSSSITYSNSSNSNCNNNNGNNTVTKTKNVIIKIDVTN